MDGGDWGDQFAFKSIDHAKVSPFPPTPDLRLLVSLQIWSPDSFIPLYAPQTRGDQFGFGFNHLKGPPISQTYGEILGVNW